MGILRKHLYLLSWQSSRNYIWEKWSASFPRVISQEFYHYNYQAMHICRGGRKVRLLVSEELGMDKWRKEQLCGAKPLALVWTCRLLPLGTCSFWLGCSFPKYLHGSPLYHSFGSLLKCHFSLWDFCWPHYLKLEISISPHTHSDNSYVPSCQSAVSSLLAYCYYFVPVIVCHNNIILH